MNLLFGNKEAYFENLFKKYRDMFAWNYEDIKAYDTRIIQHINPIKEGVKNFHKKLRKMHPTLELLIQKS
jgi:hypothetical protein